MRFRSQPQGMPPLECQVPVSERSLDIEPSLDRRSTENPAAIEWEVPVASWSVGSDKSSPSEPDQPQQR